MGAVRFSIDPGLVRELKSVLSLNVFVETGTYEGDSVRAALPLFDELHTIELSASLYSRAADAFEGDAKVHVHHGRSEAVLKELVPRLRRKSVLYWLDAHWCDEKGEGGAEQCPLLDELKAIGSLSERSAVLIDDARLFLAPPPPPARAEGWPELGEVLEHLSAMSSTHELLVVDDVFVFFPPNAASILREYARHHAVDWLHELQAGRRVGGQVDRLRSQVVDFRDQVTTQQRDQTRRLTKKIETIGSNLQALAAEVEALEERSAQALWELPQARADIRSLDERLEPLEGRFDSLASLAQAIRDEVREVQAGLRQVESHSAESPQAISELPEALERVLDERMSALETELQRIQALDRAISRQSRTTEMALRQIGALRDQMESLEGQVEQMHRRRRPIMALVGTVKRSTKRIRLFVGGSLRRLGTRLWGARLGSVDHHSPRKLRIPRRYRRTRTPEQAPRISIVTPSDDRAAFLDRTIQSVLDQDYEPLEYIVEGAAATEETAEVLRRYGDRLAYSERQNGGPARALNLGFDHATGQLMSYVRSDALLLPGALPYVARYFHRHPEVDVVYGHRVLVDAEDNEVGRWVLPRHNDDVLSWADYVPQEAVFWRRRVWEAAGGQVDEDLREAMDWELLLRFREVGARMARVPRFLGAVRVPDLEQRASGQMSSNGHDDDETRHLLTRVHGRKVSDEEAHRAVRGYLRRHVMLQKLYRLHLLRY